MMEGQTRLFVVAVVLLGCMVATFAEKIYVTADFEERRKDRENAFTTGKLYYSYETTKPTSSRLRFEHDVMGTNVSNLYHYDDGAAYSMCPASKSCTGILITEGADPWYYDANYYEKTGTEGGLNWYKRKDYKHPSYAANVKVGAQVSRILMDEKAGSSNQIKKIEFSDGRTLTLDKVNHNTVPDYKLTVDKSLDCPKATCPIYADLIFVLDNSGSVDGTEWKQTANFVNGVLDTFTFGDDAAEAAIIQFNGAYTNGGCSRRKVDGCNLCYTDYTFQSGYSYPGYATADFIAYKDNGQGKTVSDDVTTLKKVMSGNRPSKIGNTCQGYGLELAMAALDRTPRKRYGKPPQPIIIAVTDGEDMCPNKTADAAEKLRSKYDAFVIEIGVGMSKSCNNYYRKFLERIASKIGDESNAAYYPVDNYGVIYEVTEKLFKPLCDGFNTQCGPDCLGFCGCGKCMCPSCDKSTSTCYDIVCQADDTSSTGCAHKDIPCDLPENVCQWYSCDGTKSKEDERCSVVMNTCDEKKKANPGTCREYSCSTSAGGCYVTLNHALCQAKHGNKCEEYECTPEGVAVEDKFKETGCRLKTNKTKKLEDELKSSGKDKCASAACDPDSGVYEKVASRCTSSNDKCYAPACVKRGNSYECGEVDYKRPKDTQCTKYKCSDEAGKGWVVASSVTAQFCLEKFREQDPESTVCQNVFCDPNIGCTMTPMNGCDSHCTDAKIKECVQTGATSTYSSTGHCVLGGCIVVKDDPNDPDRFHLDCNYTDTVENCYESMYDQVKALNYGQSEICYTPTCGEDGRCTYKPIDKKKPNSPADDYCMHWACRKQEDGEWDWTWVPTEFGESCMTDECRVRTCHPDTKTCDIGEELCSVKTNNCYSYACEIRKHPYDYNFGYCVETSLLINTTCTYEVCDTENNKKVQFQNLEPCVDLVPLTKCQVHDCVYDAATMTSECIAIPKPAPGNDPCVNYTCDEETGNFTEGPKCDDGLYCTENQCTIFGECKFPAIRCSDRIPMDGYPCFEARCKEDPDNKKFKCVRKLIPNAYIDVCGKCIIEDYSSEAFSGSVMSQNYEESVDYVGCTGAPAKPILTEGLAAASIALIILAAVLIGAGIAASGVLGTKALIDRAKGANNQSAHSNPLFEDNEAEMTNPAFVEAA